jgi:hypothetical protein
VFQIEGFTEVRLTSINPRMEKQLFPDYKPNAPLTATDVFIAGATAH